MWGDCYVPTLATEGEEEASSKGCLTGATLYVTRRGSCQDQSFPHLHDALACVCRYFPGIATSGRLWADMGMPGCMQHVPHHACFHALLASYFSRFMHADLL
jgi:hypothetical protein